MGNHISCRPSDGSGKVILSDGTIHRYDQPLTVGELMIEHPQQVVVEIQSILNGGRKASPLPADNKLEKNKVYLMLPIKRGKPTTLSSEEARRLLLSANSVLKSKSLVSILGLLPLFAKICSADTGDGQEFVLHRKENLAEKIEETNKERFFPETLEGQRLEYLSRQFSGKGWKPNLYTIMENKVKTKVRHWLF
ncbi:unnamed protein product [Ilex paraguariensis]|uniref:Multidrug resistance protein ABC transporter family protein n=1 Tax=Ilex paraguariensis TaxID=185542 RepID=A0ABC8S6X3_9AQUA